MASKRSANDLGILREIRDSLIESYKEKAKTPMSQYSFQDRQVIYMQMSDLQKEIDRYDRKILLAEGTITGRTKADFSNLPNLQKP